jgi:hypothetical protein
MNKKLFIICFAAITVIAKPLVAQEATEWSKNVVKLNLFALATQNISLQYERALHKNISLALQVGFTPTHDLTSVINDQIATASNNVIHDIKISGVSITPEFRWYPGKKVEKQAPRGFYLSAYLRYAKYTANAFYTYKDSSYYPLFVKDVPGTTSISYSGIGTGLMLGYQWVISNRVSIDWWILGAHGGSAVLSGSISASGMNAADAKEQIDAKHVPNLVTTVTGPNSLDLKQTGPFAGLRTGFCIGIAF